MEKKPAREGARRNEHRRHIPQVLIEKILLNLPMKSLFRFSAVSESWRSMIFAPEFAKGYRGREMIVLRAYCGPEDRALVCPLSSLSSDDPIAGATPFVRPFRELNAYVNASCGLLWCVEFENSVILYNPSIQSYRKLPVPSAAVPIGSTIPGTTRSIYLYGLGYDSVSDDYKVVKIHDGDYAEAELYSLASDCWKRVESRPPPLMTFLSTNGIFVNGAIHWLIHLYDENFDVFASNKLPSRIHAILSFDLTTEQFGVLNHPPLPRKQGMLNITVIRGKLCVYNMRLCKLNAWVLEDHGWSHEFEIDYGDQDPLCYSYLKPFYFYDKHGNLIKAVTSSADMRNVFVYKDKDKDGSASLEAKSFGIYGTGMFDTYVESFVSPWPPGHGANEIVSVAAIEREEGKRGLVNDEKRVDANTESSKGKAWLHRCTTEIEIQREEEGERKRKRISIIDHGESSKRNHGP